MGVKSPKLLSENAMPCLYGIFDHSEHIIFSCLGEKTLNLPETPKSAGHSVNKDLFDTTYDP